MHLAHLRLSGAYLRSPASREDEARTRAALPHVRCQVPASELRLWPQPKIGDNNVEWLAIQLLDRLLGGVRNDDSVTVRAQETGDQPAEGRLVIDGEDPQRAPELPTERRVHGFRW